MRRCLSKKLELLEVVHKLFFRFLDRLGLPVQRVERYLRHVLAPTVGLSPARLRAGG